MSSPERVSSLLKFGHLGHGQGHLRLVGHLRHLGHDQGQSDA